LGQWLVARFRERGWRSYRQAAEYTGISHTQLRGYVQTTTAPRHWVLERLAEKFDVPLSVLETLDAPERTSADKATESTDDVVRATFATVQRLEREMRLLREQLATYGVASPRQEEVEVSEEPSTPAGRPEGIVPADPRAPERAEEPDIFRMVREALNKLEDGAGVPLAPEDIRAQLKSVGGDLAPDELQSIVDYVAFTRWRRWRREHGLDA
jgi:transcriptional regulator with XRE-family HTH domain